MARSSNNNLNITNINSNSYRLSPEQQLQYQVEQRHLELYRQSSFKSAKNVTRNDLESKINRLYSRLLVNYHWVFLVCGVIITFVLTGVSFIKQPLPNFLDPKRGFGARGEGTLTSQLIVMKNVNAEMTKYHKEVLSLYEKIKKENRSESWKIDENTSHSNSSLSNTYDFYSTNGTEYTEENGEEDGGSGDETEPDYETQNDFDDYEEKTLSESQSKNKTRKKRQSASEYLSNDPPSKDLMGRFIYKKLKGEDIFKMLPQELTINNNSKLFQNHAFNKVKICNYSLSLDTNLEFYFSSSTPPSSLENLTSSSFKQQPPIDDDNDFENNSTSDLLFQLNLNDDFFNEANEEVNLDVKSKSEIFKNMEENLLNVRKLRSLCEWDTKILNMLTSPHKKHDVCYFSLPFVVAILNNKTDCMTLTNTDVKNFLKIVLKCYDLHSSGALYAAAEELKTKPEIIRLINKNNPLSQFIKLPIIKDNVCFKHNLLHIFFEYLVDKEFLSDKKSNMSDMINSTNIDVVNNKTIKETFSKKSFNIKTSSLLIINSQKTSVKTKETHSLFSENFLYEFYLKYFHHHRYDDHETKLTSINLMGLRENAAMRFISQEMILVALAIILIVIVTLLYLKSIFISLIVNLGVGMSVGVAFFAYRIVFDIDLFPFINMMAAFLLIGIACDNVYVLFDSWYTEKGRVIMEDLPDMIEKQYTIQRDETSNNTTDSSMTTSVIKAVDEYFLPPIFIQRRFLNVNTKKENEANSETKSKVKNPIYTKQSSTENLAEKEAFLNDQKHQEKNSKSIKPISNGQAVLGKTSLNTELMERGIDISNYELNPAYVRLAPLTDEQMVRAMGGTLRHAASSIFVTSFTTAAAFLTNYITKLPYVQLFGVFTGMCILIYFSMVITMVAAFVITYEKNIQPFRCKVRTKFTDKLENLFQKAMDYVSLLNYRVISQWLPEMLIKFRIVLFLFFLVLGVLGLLTVFVWPKLKPPSNWRYQFFKDGNLFEKFEFETKDQFYSYVNEEKRNLTNPEIFFVFGILNKDTGRIFNPDDDGHLLYDKKFDFFDNESQVWLNNFINVSIASRPDLFQAEEIVQEWTSYLFQIQLFCHDIFGISDNNKITVPVPRDKLIKCRETINSMLVDSTVESFEELMASFPRRIIFMSNGSDVNGLLLRINSNRMFTDYETVRDYYLALKQFHEETYAKAPDGFKSGWFISIAFALYDLQYQLITGTYSSLVASMGIALIILLLTSGNVIISAFAIITISFTIADTIAIFVFLGWNLSFLESIVIIMSVGLSVDFSCHYGVAYMNSEGNQAAQLDRNGDLNKSNNKKQKKSFTDTNGAIHKKSILRDIIDRYNNNNKDRFMRIYDIFARVGSAVGMAAFTTFLAGFSMYPSSLTSFSKMGQFLMLVMCLSYIFATFFFVPMCALFGPTKDFGNLNIGNYCTQLYSFICNRCARSSKKKDTKKQTSKKSENQTKLTPKEEPLLEQSTLNNPTMTTSPPQLKTSTSKV